MDSPETESAVPTVQPSTNGHSPEETVNIGLSTPFVEKRSYSPPPNVVELFMFFRANPEEAWMKAGLPRRALARKRRILADFLYIFFGKNDIMGDQMISLAGEAGLDDKAMKRAERVAAHIPQPTFQDRFDGPARRDQGAR